MLELFPNLFRQLLDFLSLRSIYLANNIILFFDDDANFIINILHLLFTGRCFEAQFPYLSDHKYFLVSIHDPIILLFNDLVLGILAFPMYYHALWVSLGHVLFNKLGEPWLPY